MDLVYDDKSQAATILPANFDFLDKQLMAISPGLFNTGVTPRRLPASIHGLENRQNSQE